jgi:pimeloyl-ACP methyl ester carboxylesterase
MMEPELSLAPPGIVRRPHTAHTALRAVGELATLVRHLPTMQGHARDHDGQGVLVLPGFLAVDPLTAGLRRILEQRGYAPHGWRQGLNVGPTDRILDGLRSRIERLAAVHEEPISVIGWSLGGLYARQLAREYPELVRQVITLGSPINLTLDDTHLTAVHRVFEQMKRFYSAELEEIGRSERDKTQLTVPATSIYTKTDEVVPWWTCVDSSGKPEISENIEVRGTHVGLPQNRAVVHAILHQLALPVGAWHHFTPHADHAHHYPLHTKGPPLTR